MTKITSLPKLYSGKVRELYDIDDKTMLMVTSDRISTFDVILNNDIPNKGIYLNQISLFWFKSLKDIINNHLTGQSIDSILTAEELAYAKNRSVIVRKLKPVPVECIVRGYLAGSGYQDYLKDNAICGIKLPNNLQNASKLPEPIFTPSTKAPKGSHDENINLQECQNLIGTELTKQISEASIKIYTKATEFAKQHGLIIADTKFEFGTDENGQLLLMDEVLTPDSSRYWDEKSYVVGQNPPSFDKQFVRDYLQLNLKWNKKPPIPDLSSDVITKTQDKYYEIIKRFNILIEN